MRAACLLVEALLRKCPRLAPSDSPSPPPPSQELLGSQRAEYEAAVARHLAFVDRLLADKDTLTRRVAELADAVKARLTDCAWLLPAAAGTLQGIGDTAVGS